MSENEDYNYLERMQYATGKLTGEALVAVPGGTTVAKALDTVCEKLDWAKDYVNQNKDETRGAGCDGIKSALAGNLGAFSPGAEGSKDQEPRRR